MSSPTSCCARTGAVFAVAILAKVFLQSSRCRLDPGLPGTKEAAWRRFRFVPRKMARCRIGVGCNDEATLFQYWRRVLGHKLLSEITPRDLAEQRDVLVKTKKASTVLHQLRVLSAVFTAAVKDFGVLETNPMFKVRMPAQPQGRIRYLADGERERLLLACQSSKNEHLYGLVLCAISTGMRCGELLNIRYGDCDLERGVIHLERTKTKRRRAVPLTGKALEMLRAMSHGHRPEEYVFPATNRKAPFRSYKKAWEFARKRAGIENYHFHDNHNSTGSYLAE